MKFTYVGEAASRVSYARCVRGGGGGVFFTEMRSTRRGFH